MSETLLAVENLIKHFPVREGVFGRATGAVRAVDGISFSIPRGTTLSLVGESGSGKTTAGRSILRLIEPTGGKILFDGIDLASLGPKDLRELRKRIQIVFQDPYGSLNPRMTIYSMLSEAMKAHGIGNRHSRRDRCYELLSLVGLPPQAADRYPHEFSGGQRQRIGIARALAVEPELIVADEPVSALDVSVQAQILNLMKDLQQKLGLTYLFIGHDLSVIRHISDAVAVMYLGRIVEIGPADELFRAPVHPYTQALLSAVPEIDPDRTSRRIILQGDVPSPIHPPSGCHFHPRCPSATPDCATRLQMLTDHAKGHRVACHIQAPGKPTGP
jgi:oligopeptide transport system ATP-binding protein